MIEPVGLTIGVIGLGGLFSSAIDCFEHVRIAKTFDRDFATAQLHLDEAGLRLSRWGKAIGIHTAGIGTMADDRYKKAEKSLEHICDLFSQAKEKSELYEEVNAAMYDTEEDLAHPHRAVHRGIIITVQKRMDRRLASFAKRTKWALSEKKDLDSLIEGIFQGVKYLETLLPMPEQESQIALQSAAELEVREIQEVAQAEVAEAGFQKAEVVKTLEMAAEGINPYMEEVVKKLIKAMKTEGQSTATTYNVSQNIDKIESNQGFVAGHSSGNNINYYGR